MNFDEFAQDILKKQGASLGVFVDGDADRVVLVDSHGNLYDGNMLLAFLGTIYNRQKRLSKNTVVTTKMSNSGLGHYLGSQGIKVKFTKNGDKYITDVLVDKDLTIGGEAIGHIIIHDNPYHLTGDGLRSALHIISNAVQSKAGNLQELAPGMQKWPQIKISVPVGRRTKILAEQISGLQEACQAVLLEIGDITQLECRPASTEPIYRIMLNRINTPVHSFGQEC